MIIEVVSTILLLFVGFLIFIILIPIIIALFLYFTLRNDSKSKNLLDIIKKVVKDLLNRFIKAISSPGKTTINNNKVEDAEFKEIE